MSTGGLMRRENVIVEAQEWGRLEWMVSRAIGNSDALTVGRCYIDPGQQNPPHHHPNCDEVLHVVRGTIVHRVGDERFEMSAGDTVSIPADTVHNARNIGAEQAVFVITFSSAERVTVGE